MTPGPLTLEDLERLEALLARGPEDLLREHPGADTLYISAILWADAREAGERLTAALRSVMAERDALLAMPTGIGRFIHSAAKANAEAADLQARLSRAREALGVLLHCGPKGYDLEALMDTPEEVQALAALRAALAEPPS